MKHSNLEGGSHLINRSILFIKRNVSLFLIFAMLKSLTYFVPFGVRELLMSNTLYGEFELELNLGQMLTGILLMGLVGSYAFFVMKHNKIELIPIFHIHFIIIIFLLCGLIVFIPKLLSNNYFGAVLLALAFADQIFISGILKTINRNLLAVLVDSGVYIILSIILLLAFLNVSALTKFFWHSSILVYLLISGIFFHAARTKNFLNIRGSDIFQVYKFGGLIVLSGPLLVLITSSTRIYIEYFATIDDVAVFSFFFRLASVILLFSRVFVILMYRRFYLDTHQNLDNYFYRIFIVLFCLTIGVAVSIPIILKYCFPIQFDYFSNNSSLFFLSLFHILFWICVSFFEPVIQREYKMKMFLGVLLIYVIILVGIYLVFDFLHILNLNVILIINSVVLFFLFLGQHFILRKSNVRYPKTKRVHSIFGFFYLIFIVLFVFIK